MLDEYVLFTDQTANGNSEAITWPGGVGTLLITGTWDGATIKLQAAGQESGATFTDVLNGEFTSPYLVENVAFGKGTKVRANLSSAGASTSLSVEIKR